MIAVIAEPSEIKLLDDNLDYIITGVGAVNIINSLQSLDKNTIIYNIGYVGSNIIPIGTKVRVGKVMTYHPNAQFTEPTWQLDGDIPCYTAGDFVLKADIKEPCVFDMELAYILALGFTNVISEKIVSDNLNKEEFNEYGKYTES